MTFCCKNIIALPRSSRELYYVKSISAVLCATVFFYSTNVVALKNNHKPSLIRARASKTTQNFYACATLCYYFFSTIGVTLQDNHEPDITNVRQFRANQDIIGTPMPGFGIRNQTFYLLMHVKISVAGFFLS